MPAAPGRLLAKATASVADRPVDDGPLGPPAAAAVALLPGGPADPGGLEVGEPPSPADGAAPGAAGPSPAVGPVLAVLSVLLRSFRLPLPVKA